MVLPLALTLFFLSLASSPAGASIHPWLPRLSYSSLRSPPPFLLPLLASWAAIIVLLCLSGLARGDEPQETGRNVLVSSQESGESLLPLSPEQQTRVPCVSQQLWFHGFPAPPQPSPAATERQSDGLDTGSTAAGSFSSKVWIFPPFLEWGNRPLFSPSALPVTITNRCNSTLLTVFPPFSSSIQFYAAAFAAAAQLEIQPGGEVTLDVVFLPQSLGQAQAVVLLQTNVGGFFLQVQGTGVVSPFGLAALGRSSVAPGQTLRLSVSLDNQADDRAIRVTEARSWPADSSNRTLVLTNPGNDEVGVTRCCPVESSSSCSCVDQEDTGSYLTMRPAASWEIDPGCSSSVVEVEFKAGDTPGSWNGFVYLGLSLVSSSSREEVGDEQLVIPFNVRVGGQAQVLQPVPEVINFGFLSSTKEVKRQALALRNTGLESLEVSHVSRLSPGNRKNLIAVRFRKAIVVHPGTQVQVAVAWYRGLEESMALVNDGADSPGLEQLAIHTNSSSGESKIVRVPLHAVVLHGSEIEGDDGEGDERVLFVESGVHVRLSQFEKLERRIFGKSEIESSIFPSGGVEVDAHQQLIASRSLFGQSGVMLPAVQVGESEVVWLRLKNPSDGPVSVKLLLSYEWEASDCQCSSSDCKARDDKAVVVVQETGVTYTVIGAYQEVDVGPLVFRPTRRCTWTGLLAVKNNLTAVDWIPVRGTGSSAELKFLEDNVPVETLRLVGTSLRLVSTVTSGIDENLSSLSEKTNPASCKQPVNGSFLARNTGDIPLRVHSVALMSGGCSSHGFELGSCSGFLLAAGEAAQIKLSYRSSDFASPQVRHNSLQFVTSIGIVNIPVMVVLPDHMLRLCASIPAYFKYKKLFVYAGFFGLLCTVLVLPAKVGGKKISASDCDDGPGMASSLPLFSPSSIIADDSTSPAKLSKIRVKVSEELRQDSRDQASEDKQVSATDFLQVAKQQHSIAMSPGSSPRRAQLERGGKRKRKKGPVSLVKHEASRSGASSPVSSPASPLDSQRPVSPLFSSDDHQASADSSKVSRLDVEVGRRMISSSSLSSSSSSSSAWIPKDDTRKKGTASELKSSKDKHHQHKATANIVVRKSAPESGKASPTSSTPGDKIPNRKKALTQSATFPNSSRDFQLQSQISPSARAPGSKIPKSSTVNSDTSSELNDSSSSSCNTSSRFSGDDIVEQTASCSTASTDLIYDIWGDHLGDMSRRQSKYGGEETQSLFSVPAFPLSKQENSSEFSMFSGNAVAAFNRMADIPDEQQQQQQEQDFSSSYFLLSPFDLSYGKRIHFSSPDGLP